MLSMRDHVNILDNPYEAMLASLAAPIGGAAIADRSDRVGVSVV